MATKTVVCPECGSSAGPGRYACGECGALLAAVSMTPRGWDSDAGRAAAAPPAVADDGPAPEPPAAAEPPAPEPPAADAAIASAAPAPPDVPPDLPVDSEPWPEPAVDGAFDEDAPLGSSEPAGASTAPDVLHAVTDGDGDLAAAAVPSAPARDEPMLIDETHASAGAAAAGAAPAGAAPADTAPAATAVPPAPAWPPPGDRGPIARPEPRTPAGAYLPPSAVLPSLDLPSAGGAVAVAGVASRPDPAASFTGRASAAVSEALASVRVTGDAGRRAVATGAGIAALGTLLPWVNTLPGASPIANYLDRWGLAGGGIWLVLLGLVALAVVAGSTGRAAAWPVGLPAVATAAFLIGLIWPYLLGGFGRAVGVWVLLVGAVVLAVGGVLETRRRHGTSELAV